MTEKKKKSHQYIFGYEALPGAFRNDKDAFMDYLEDDGLDFLTFWWDHVGEKYAEGERMSAAGMAYEIRKVGKDGRIALITLPVPKRHGEAYFVALVHPRRRQSIFPWKNYGLVYSLSHIEKDQIGRNDTIFGEWTPRGHFVPGEEGIPPELEKFYQKVIKAVGKV